MMRQAAVLRILLFVYFVHFLGGGSALAEIKKPVFARTIRLKIAFDEEFRGRPARVFEIKRWVSGASCFFERNFGLKVRVQRVAFWPSDNTKGSLISLLGDLYKSVDRDGCDIVVGVTSQITGNAELSGLASYLHGYILMRNLLRYELNELTLVHELCHLFGAVDLEEKDSIMNKADARLRCDTFTREIVLAHRNRRFDGVHFPLEPEGRESAIALYEQRKSLGRREAGVRVLLALFYVMKNDPERAIQACLEAERIEPDYPGLQMLLKMASKQKKRPSRQTPQTV